MKDDKYIPNGQLQGDTAPMVDRGTSVGMGGDSYGADLSQEATNRMGSIASAAKSDPMDECYSDDIALGAPAGDNDSKAGY